MTSLTIDAGQGKKTGTTSKAAVAIKNEVLVWGIRTALIAEGSSLELSARRPDGSIEVLLWIPTARQDFPAPYIFEDPVRLPAGTVVTLTARTKADGPPATATLTLHQVD